MSKKLTIFLVCLCASLSVFSQTGFENGHYLRNDGSVVKGLIKNEDWKTNPTSIEFKANAGSEAQTISLLQMKGFEIENKTRYVRARVDVDMSPDNLNNLTINSKPLWEARTVLLRMLIDGKATLYYYEGSGLQKYYFKTDEKPIEALFYKRYLKNGDAAENNQYQQQLLNNLSGCAQLSTADFYGLKYKNSPLTKLFITYNNCVSGEGVAGVTNYNPKENKVDFKVNAFVGMNYLSVDVTNSVAPSRGGDFGNAIRLRFGVELEALMPFNNNKWGLFIGFAKNTKFEQTTTQATSSVNNPTQEVTFTYSSFDIPFGIRHYFFVGDDSKVSLHLGYMLDVISEVSIERSITANDLNGSATTGNLFGGAGFHYKKFSAEARLDFGRDPIEESTFFYEANTTSFSFVLGYQLF